MPKNFSGFILDTNGRVSKIYNLSKSDYKLSGSAYVSSSDSQDKTNVVIRGEAAKRVYHLMEVHKEVIGNGGFGMDIENREHLAVQFTLMKKGKELYCQKHVGFKKNGVKGNYYSCGLSVSQSVGGQFRI